MPGVGQGIGIEVGEVTAEALAEYASISIAFEVSHVLDLVARDSGLGGFLFTERVVDAPYIKDYDAEPGEAPGEWPGRFDLSNWGLIVARSNGRPIGGATVAFDTRDLHMLEGRRDVAILWDIRVAPEARGRGIGSMLFAEAVSWARARGCEQLKIETQNINVPACRFYAAQGCVLGAVHRFAYRTLPGEIQLLWYRRLSGET